METKTDACPFRNGNENNEIQEDVFYDVSDGSCFCKDQEEAVDDSYYKIKELIFSSPRQDTHYKMDHKRRGVAYIFNHEFFEDLSYTPRKGTNEDSKDLKQCLAGLGFEVQVFKDLNIADIGEHLRTASQMDHTNHDCIVIAVMSHGGVDKIHAKDFPYRPHFLWANFTAENCPSLAGKPKIFLIQACQGENTDVGITLRMSETDAEVHESFRIPPNVQSDCLVVYSTVKGNVSWRSTTEGSWFIQCLCEELQKRGYEHDFLTILTFVSQRVAIDFESYSPANITMHGMKQIPCILSRLTKLIQFRPAA